MLRRRRLVPGRVCFGPARILFPPPSQQRARMPPKKKKNANTHHVHVHTTRAAAVMAAVTVTVTVTVTVIFDGLLCPNPTQGLSINPRLPTPAPRLCCGGGCALCSRRLPARLTATFVRRRRRRTISPSLPPLWLIPSTTYCTATTPASDIPRVSSAALSSCPPRLDTPTRGVEKSRLSRPARVPCPTKPSLPPPPHPLALPALSSPIAPPRPLCPRRTTIPIPLSLLASSAFPRVPLIACATRTEPRPSRPHFGPF